MKSKILTVMFLGFALLGCSPTDVKMEKRSLDPQTSPIYELKDLICGGGRSMGKHLAIGGNSCSMPSTSDETCDRWGCSIIKNSQGDLDCPAGTVKRITDTTPVEYFICILPEGSATRGFKVCGGTRLVGKGYGAAEECTSPATSDNSCNRFGCAEMQDSITGNSGCPSGKQAARISDDLTSFLCLE